MDLRVDTETIATILSTNCVDSRSSSSRFWAFRRTHTSTDPIRLLCIRLALPLTLSLPSGFAPSARLMVGVPPRTLWLAGIFLRRKKRCAGAVGTRTDWALKGEEGGMTTPLLQYVARFDGGGRDCWVWREKLQGELAMVLSVCRIPVSICCAKRRATSLPIMCWKGTSLSTISRVFVPIFFFEQSVVVDVEGMGFRPRAVVPGRGFVAVCTRISSQEYVYDK